MKARFLLALSLAFGSVFLAIPAQADPIATVWENSPVGVYLPEGVTFISVSGWYGAPDDPSCGVDVSDVLTALAVGQNHFDVVASNSVFGDPCGGVYKVLKITGVSADFAQQQPVETPEPTSPEPTATPSPEPTQAESTPSPTPQQTASPEPTPVEPSPSPSPVIEPVTAPPAIVPQPQPEPIPYPVAPEPAPEPVAPSPEPVAPTPEPVAPSPAASVPTPVAPSPAPIAPVVVITPAPAPAETPPIPVTELTKQDPQTLTVAEVAQITEAATATLATEPQGSPAYNQALEQLMVVAQADDPQLPTAIASIPLLGNAAVAVLDAFNNLGNLGADMSPKVRKTAKHEVVAAVIVGQVTTTATMAASSSMAYRRKETK